MILVEPPQSQENLSISKPDSSLGRKISRKERGRASRRWGTQPPFCFDAKRETFCCVAEVQRELLAALESISVEDFRQCFHQRKWRWDRYIQSHAECFEGD